MTKSIQYALYPNIAIIMLMAPPNGSLLIHVARHEERD